MTQNRHERLIPSRAFSRCRHRPLGGAHRSSLALCHRPSGTDMRPGITPASPTSALATIAPVCHHLLLSCSDNACGARCVPPIALCAMPRHQTHAGRTQGIPLSAAGVWEPLCGRVCEHGRYIPTYLCHARCHRRHETSWSRRVRGARAATTTTAVAGRVPVVGRVPSGPLGGRTGTAGPADCDSTFAYHILTQRAKKSPARLRSGLCRLRATEFVFHYC